MQENEVCVIYGPTASGKSAIAKKISSKLKSPIINFDSLQVYRQLRILSSRPSSEDEKIIDHRLYGIIDGKIDDPNKSRIVGILNEFNEISSRIKLLEEELDNFNTKDRFIEDSFVECEKKKKNNDLGNENETNIKR